MAYVIAQLSDVHVGGPHAGSGERFSEAIAEINAMRRQPDLVLLTGDNTHNSTDAEWDEFTQRLTALNAPWEAINGNHDRTISAAAGHRVLDAGPLRLVLVDSSHDEFTTDDATWLDTELAARPDDVTVIAIHHPPFETGIWWMDCVGLEGADLFEQVVRRHRQVIKVLSGHVHRTIQTNWNGCSLWVSPSTSSRSLAICTQITTRPKPPNRRRSVCTPTPVEESSRTSYPSGRRQHEPRSNPTPESS